MEKTMQNYENTKALLNALNSPDPTIVAEAKKRFYEKFNKIFSTDKYQFKLKSIPDKAEVYNKALLKFYDAAQAGKIKKTAEGYFRTILTNECSTKLGQQQSINKKRDLSGDLSEEAVVNRIKSAGGKMIVDADETIFEQLSFKGESRLYAAINRYEENDFMALAFKLFKEKYPEHYNLIYQIYVEGASYKSVSEGTPDAPSTLRTRMVAIKEIVFKLFFKIGDSLNAFAKTNAFCAKLLGLKYKKRTRNPLLAKEFSIPEDTVNDRIDKCLTRYIYFFKVLNENRA